MSAQEREKTTKFKITKNKSPLSSLQGVFSSCSSLGNPPFLWKKQLNYWWNKWTKPPSRPKSAVFMTSSTCSDPLDWFARQLYPHASLVTNGLEHNTCNIWSWKNNILRKTQVWTSLTVNIRSKTLKSLQARSFL